MEVVNTRRVSLHNGGDVHDGASQDVVVLGASNNNNNNNSDVNNNTNNLRRRLPQWLSFKMLTMVFVLLALVFYFSPTQLFSTTIYLYHSSNPGERPSLALSRVFLNTNTEKENTCPALLASINSIQMNSKRPIHLHVLIGPGDLAIFTKTIGDWIDIPTEIVEFNDARVKPIIKVWDGLRFHKNTLNYARFYLPEIFPQLKRIVYVDPDTIVKVDIAELNDKLDEHPHNLPNNYLAAVPANLLTFIRSSYAFILSCRDPEIAAAVNCADDFFNAGVFVTDLEKWREENITGQSEYWLTQNTQRRLWKWGSQPPLNLVFYRRWSRLEAEWNFRETGRANFDPEMINYVKIIHFTGHAKPWKTSGGKYWKWWCDYYPRKSELWFCNEGGLQSLIPNTPIDYGFMRRTMVDGLREKDFNI